MNKEFYTNAVLQSLDNIVYAIIGTQRFVRESIDDRELLSVIESFVFGCSLEVGYQRFVNARNMIIPPEIRVMVGKLRKIREPVILFLSHNKLTMSKPSGEVYDLTDSSRQYPRVLSLCFELDNFNENREAIADFNDYCAAVKRLRTLGLVTPLTGMLDWGDFKRFTPFCPDFGLTRGTPIDRVYLDKFIAKIASTVTGSALEIGGLSDNKTLYGFHACTEYHGLDLKEAPGVSYVGDAHDTALFDAGSFESILLFNVLEHCYAPQKVIDNIFCWLKPGGKCFLMVPNAQRVHDYPADYWRPLPDGIKYLFREYKEMQLYVYGNPVTLMASMMGVAAEELASNEIDPHHPEYPVVTCVVATK